MATLFNTKIKDTYQSLLKLEDNTILTTIVKNVTDGLGNASPLYMSTTRIGIGTNAPAYTLDAQGTAASQIRVKSTTAGAYIDYSNSSGSTYSFGAYLDGFITVFGGTVTSLLKSDGTNTFGNSLTSLGARVGIKGSGSTSATTSLLVQNSSSNTTFQVLDNGLVYVGTGFTGLSFSGANSQIFNNGGSAGRISFAMGGVSYIEIYQPINNGGGFTSGTLNNISTPFTYTNTSGAVSYNLLSISPGINNTGTYTGTIRGIYYNPSITSLTGTTHIALETVTGNVLLGTTSGFVGIGTSNPTNPLDVAYSPGRLISFRARTGYADYGQIVFNSVTTAEIISSGSIALGPSDTSKTLSLGNGLVSKITTPGSTKYDGFGNQTPATLAGAGNQPVLFTSSIGDGNIDGFIFENTSSGSRNLFKLIQNNTTLLTVNPNGNVLINTTTDAGYKLDVNGSTRVKANSLTISASGLTSPVPSNYVALNFDDAPNHHERWFSINSVKDLNGYVAGLGTSYDRIIFPVKGSGHSAWQFDAYGTSSEIQISARNSTTGNYLSLTNSSINFCGPWTVASIDRTNRKLVFGDMSTDVHHLAAYDIVIKGSKPFEANSGGYPNGGNVYVVGGTPSTSPAGNYGNVILAHDGTTARGAVVVGGTTAAASAIVDVQSTTKGVLFPRMTNAQRGLIASPAIGLLVYCTDATEGLYIYKSTGWTFIA